MFLRRIDARFAQLVPFQYESVGTLQFINWSGGLEGDSFMLKIHRLESLTEKLTTGQLRVIADDHSLTRDYFAAACG